MLYGTPNPNPPNYRLSADLTLEVGGEDEVKLCKASKKNIDGKFASVEGY